MSWVATAVVGGSLLGAGGAYLGSKEAGESSETAARTEAESADRAAELQNEMYQQAQGYTAPARQAGYTATPLLEYLTTGVMPELTSSDMSDVRRLQRMETLDPNQQTQLDQYTGRQNAINVARGGMQSMIEQSPMYQYQRDIGNKQMNRMLQSRGRSNSSFGINALGDYNRGLIANESQNLYNRVAGLANAGQGMDVRSGFVGNQPSVVIS